MFGFGKKKAKPSSGCLSEVEIWKIPQPKKAETLDGDAVAKVYVYDAAPLAEIDPDGFLLQVAYCDGVLKSQYTGTTSNTKSSDFVIVMYDNLPIGTIAIDRKKVEQAAASGIALNVKAYSDGWMQFGSQSIRNVKAKVPESWIA